MPDPRDLRDESSRKARERAERRYRAILELAALDKSDFDRVLRRILETDAEQIGAARVNCWVLEFQPEAIRCICGITRGSRDIESGTVLYAGDYPIYFQALTNDPMILADDAWTDPRTRELRDGYLVPKGVTSIMDVPIWVRGALWGVICHDHQGPPRHWVEADRNFATSIGHIVSMAVEARDRAEAERVARSSEFFVGILGHDLRNPLNAVRLSAEYILAREPDEESSRAARRIVSHTEQMARMVEQLLDFTRIRLGGGLPVERTDIDLSDLVRRMIEETRTVRSKSVIGLDIVGDTHGQWDADRLWQLLSNLLSNAVDYGDNVRVVVDGRDSDRVVLQVCNHGAIEAGRLATIFEPFYRGPVASTRHGLGLGLFISREIVIAHGGTIAVESRGGETVFTVGLPRFDATRRVGLA